MWSASSDGARFARAAFALLLASACGGRSASPARDDAGEPQAPEAAAPIDACVSGASCAPAGNPCQTGVFSCSAGTPTCTAVGFVPSGTACGGDRVCLAGACVACVAGGTCSPAGNPCQTGTTSCITGQPACLPTGDVPNGQSCDAGVCCGGLCAACSTPDHATAVCSADACAVACDPGYSLCGSTCADTTSDNSACGPACDVCPTGSACRNSTCSAVVKYGNAAAYSPCDLTGKQIFGANSLEGERISIPAAIQLTALGVITTPVEPATGVDGILALYTEANGLPSSLVARTPSATIGSGDNSIAVESEVTVAAGEYWIMAEYDAMASICVDSSTTNVIEYLPVTYGDVPASLASSQPLSTSTVNFNYYVVGYP